LRGLLGVAAEVRVDDAERREAAGVRIGTYCSLNATFAEDIYTADEVVEHYASTCDLAAQYDVTCDLENLPMWGVKTLRQAWSVVSTADRPNGGMVFDTLHYIRSGSTLDMLKEIPGDRVHCVQLNDGPLRLPAGVTLEENCFDRNWPGTGEFPLIEIVRTLADMDALRQVSPEVFSSDNATRSAAKIAALSSASPMRAAPEQGARPIGRRAPARA
jgi:sugar phosphate isomerase/epimerase